MGGQPPDASLRPCPLWTLRNRIRELVASSSRHSLPASQPPDRLPDPAAPCHRHVTQRKVSLLFVPPIAVHQFLSFQFVAGPRARLHQRASAAPARVLSQSAPDSSARRP